jgi:hypothetical protein
MHDAAAAAAAAVASGASNTGIVNSGSSTFGMLGTVPSAEWLLLLQMQEEQNRRVAAAAARDSAVSAAMAAAAAACTSALPDALQNFPASQLQRQMPPEYIPVVAPRPLMAGLSHTTAQPVAAAAAQAAAFSMRPVEIVLDLHPEAFALVASSFDAVEKLSGAVLRIVERGATPLGLRVVGLPSQIETACELIRALL